MFVITILKHKDTGKFHPCYWAEAPMPGPVKPLEDESFLRFKSRGHHTGGFDSLEDAEKSIREQLMPQLGITERSVDFTPQEWDGELALVMLTSNFYRGDGQFKAA